MIDRARFQKLLVLIRTPFVVGIAKKFRKVYERFALELIFMGVFKAIERMFLATIVFPLKRLSTCLSSNVCAL